MKRMLCIVLTLAMLLTAFAVPVYAESEGIVPAAREWTEELAYFVELHRADLDADEYGRGRDEGGIATLTCEQEDAWWAERYGYNAPEIKVIFRVPEGAHYYKAAFETELTPGEAYVFNDSALEDSVSFPENEEDPVEVQLSKEIGIIVNHTLALDDSDFYALITWFDQEEKPLHGGAIEYIKVELSFPNASSSIQLPVDPVVPLPYEQFASWTMDITDFDLGFDNGTPGVWQYTFGYSIEQWEASWNLNLNRDPAVEAMILAPEGAVAYKEIAPGQVEAFDAQKVLEQSEGWETLEEREYKDEIRRVIPLRYKVGEVEKINDQYFFKTIAHEDQKLIVWKNEDGTLVDLGSEQYIQSFTMQIRHGESYDGAEIQKNTVDMVPYSRNEQPVIRNVYAAGTTEIPETLTGELRDGVFELQTAFTQEDYQQIYDSKLAGNEQIWFHVSMPVPDGAVAASMHASDAFDASAHELVLNWPYPFFLIMDDQENIVGYDDSFYRTSVDFAAIRRHESTIMIDPCDDERWLYVSWRDGNGNLINVGSAENPSYVEYIKITLTHNSKETVTVTDGTTVAAESVSVNASDWDEDVFSRAAEFENSKLVYFVDSGKLTEKYAEDPQTYEMLLTKLKAPKHATDYELTLLTTGDVTEGKVEDGAVNLQTPILDRETGEPTKAMVVQQYQVRWLNKPNQNQVKELGTQKITLILRITMENTWMDLMEGGVWKPAAKDRIGSTGTNADMEIEAQEDGTARLEYIADCPSDDELTLTVKAPDEIAGITQYRKAVVDWTYVHSYATEYEGIMLQARYELDNAALQQLGQDRKAVLSDLATYVVEEIRADKNNPNKNITNHIYLHETYNNNIEDCRIMLIEWMNDAGEVVKREYVYHEPERLDELVSDSRYSIKAVGGNNGHHYGYLLGVRHYRQLVKGAGEGEGAFYLHLWLEDENGNPVQPAEGETITVCLPYPEGSDSQCDFVIEHYEDQSHTAYVIETCERRADGIYVTLSSFSPFMLSWSEAAKEDPGSDGDEDGQPGGSSGGGSTVYPDYDAYPVLPEEKTEESWQVICRKLNVRTGAGTQYAKIGSLLRGMCIEGEMLDNGWVKFKQEDGTYGYVCGLYVSECECQDKASAAATVTCRRLNVRSGAGTQFRRIGQLSRGEEVRIVDCCSGWYKIVYDDSYAWICGKYVS